MIQANDKENAMGFDNDSDDESCASADKSISSTSESYITGKSKKGVDIGKNSDLAEQQTKAVKNSKLLVFAIIIVAAIVSGGTAYKIARDEDERDFNAQFRVHAADIVEIAHMEAANLFGAIDSMASTISSFVGATGGIWPEITIPDFDARGRKNNGLSKALQISLAPLVSHENRRSWELFASRSRASNNTSLHSFLHKATNTTRTMPSIWKFSQGTGGTKVVQNGTGIDFGPGQYAPLWQQAPELPTETPMVNFDLLSHPAIAQHYRRMWETQHPVLSGMTDLAFLCSKAASLATSFLLQPVGTAVSGPLVRDQIVALLVVVISWEDYFSKLLPSGINGVVVVLHDTCGDDLTYRIDGQQAIFLGKGDLHDTQYDGMKVAAGFEPFVNNASTTNYDCDYELHVFPTSDLEDDYTSNKPFVYASVLASVFIATALIFLAYDAFVENRFNVVMRTVKRSNDIVSSLFPSSVRDRLLNDFMSWEKAAKGKGLFRGRTSKKAVKPLEEDQVDHLGKMTTKPIADLFPEVTVMFADLVGFTAWSSVREPSQVFILLETIFAVFDAIANRRRIFKVETVGDCYVAASGLPEARKDHAVVMARYARDCLNKVNDLTKKLEVSLGPDTADLSMRFGLHSGPVTAGVLRGEKSRFQLFGDTVNVAARMENTSQKNRIQVSQETFELLAAAGKMNWCAIREDKIVVKGKGELQTYWLHPRSASGPSVCSTSVVEKCSKTDYTTEKTKEAREHKVFDKENRLVEWNTAVLQRLLREILARRKCRQPRFVGLPPSASLNCLTQLDGQTVIDEVKEIIRLPEFSAAAALNQEDPDSVKLDDIIVDQLRKYVVSIAHMYHDENPFHNFEHASHVTMSVIKLLSRIVAPTAPTLTTKEEECRQRDQKLTNEAALELHDHTYGITSDPLTQFACVFAALIHDVDHPGVPNAQLVKEQTPLAKVYRNKSVAEQNSVDIAWELFMSREFKALRDTLCPTSAERMRFRQLVVNSVMATDIIDKELKALRNARWDKAFQDNSVSDRDNINRKATIVIEHLIQASDVSHTMQHWQVYRKWNERLFHEMYHAYRTGRSDKDPSEFWYQGEIGFLDFYIIPLAKKLKDCGVFGVSSDEYLNYAKKNREEWELKGKDLVAALIDKYKPMYDMQESKSEERKGVEGKGGKDKQVVIVRRVEL